MCSCRVVFFFKQKTAYEMRISDWSSDVCSSDLVRVQVGRHHGVDRLRLRHHEGGHGVDQLEVDVQRGKVGQHVAANRVPEHHAVALGVRLGDHGKALARPAHRQLAGEAADALDALAGEHGNIDRSEEHTSELQSLMRISYAVFCLKKKKQK